MNYWNVGSIGTDQREEADLGKRHMDKESILSVPSFGAQRRLTDRPWRCLAGGC